MRTVAELAAELLTVEARAAALEEHRKALRAELEERARQEHAGSGALPRWATPVGTVSWCERKGSLAVLDDAAFRAWARATYGDRGVVESVAGFVVNEVVKTAAVTPEERELITPDGELVPGVRMGPESHYLSVRLDREAKARAVAELAVDLGATVVADVSDPPAERLDPDDHLLGTPRGRAEYARRHPGDIIEERW